MRIGMVGLGRMGGGMSERLRRAGHEVIGYTRTPDTSDVASLDELVERLDPPRVVWSMVPAGEPTSSVIATVSSLLSAGDIVVDGGNSNFRDTIVRATALAEAGISLVDSGTSGGIWGLENGYCLMVGGDETAVGHLRPLFDALAPPGGFSHVGPPGAGHFVKMVHNGIEYGLLQAYAEGFEILRNSKLYPDLDLGSIAELWRNGSVVRSWLLDLAARALSADPDLRSVGSSVADSGEGRWTVLEAIEEDTPAAVIAMSLFARFASRQDDPFAMKLIAALRREFGGHPVEPA